MVSVYKNIQSIVLVTVFRDYRDLGLQTIADWFIKLRLTGLSN